MNIGLLSVTASVYQMMRGAEMLFAAVFAVLFLHRHLNKFHLLGILCCVVSSCALCMSSFAFHTSGTKSMPNPAEHEVFRQYELLLLHT